MNNLTEDQRHQLPKDGGDNYNRLIFEDSVYLRHHAHQKINWYPWGQDAFDLAKITDKPLFLSIGYSSCHWCHVMSDTTFDHPDVAKALNEHFVAIKIDRDALPDIDQVYMAATQLLTQHGGWPNSVFCLPTGQPFYAGTYFPADDGPKGRGFLTILDQLAQAWQHRRDPLQQQAQELERVIKKMNTLVKDSVQSLTLRRSFDAMMQSISATFDSTYGGFGGAPKFPPYATLRLLLARGSSDDLAMVNTTLIAMATSSLCDHVAGGFHRYSTDAEWHLPHFEKMLSDNAQMIEIYSLAHEQCPDPLYERVVTETIAHMQDTWALGDGAYLATIDADTTDGEGYYYTMSMPELVSLGTPDQVADWAQHYQYTDEGNMYDEATGQPTGQNMCHPRTIDDPMDRDVFRHNARLFRQKHREAPLKDTRMIPSANALLAKAFLIAGRVFCQSEWQRLGDDLIDYLLTHLDCHIDALYLDDVVYLLDAVVIQGGHQDHVTKLWDMIMTRFYDHGAGGAWFSQAAHATPISRLKDGFDRAEPSPNGQLIAIGFALARTANECTNYHAIAMDILTAFLPTLSTAKMGADTYWLGVFRYWEQLNTGGDTLRVQLASAHYLSHQLVAITLDLVIEDYLICDHPLVISNDPNARWLQYQVDPAKSRRLESHPGVVSCATGEVRVQGRIQLTQPLNELQLLFESCSNTQCHSPVTITVPILKK